MPIPMPTAPQITHINTNTNTNTNTNINTNTTQTTPPTSPTNQQKIALRTLAENLMVDGPHGDIGHPPGQIILMAGVVLNDKDMIAYACNKFPGLVNKNITAHTITVLEQVWNSNLEFPIKII